VSELFEVRVRELGASLVVPAVREVLGPLLVRPELRRPTDGPERERTYGEPVEKEPELPRDVGVLESVPPPAMRGKGMRRWGADPVDPVDPGDSVPPRNPDGRLDPFEPVDPVGA